MTPREAAARQLFVDLKPGDRVQVVHEVKVGQNRFSSTTVGTVRGKERRKEGLHFPRSGDDKVYSDMLVLQRDDGELTTVAMDEFTGLKRL